MNNNFDNYCNKMNKLLDNKKIKSFSIWYLPNFDIHVSQVISNKYRIVRHGWSSNKLIPGSIPLAFIEDIASLYHE